MLADEEKAKVVDNAVMSKINFFIIVYIIANELLVSKVVSTKVSITLSIITKNITFS